MGTEDDGMVPETAIHRGAANLGWSDATARGFQLAVVEGEDTGVTWESSGQPGTIGSHPSCDLLLSDPTVSRFHCEIAMDGRSARVRDLGSRNGTDLDGIRVIEAFLKGGSLIRMGRTVVRFQLLGKRNRIPISKRNEFGILVGESVAMRAMFAILERAARTHSKVLLEGETGTGKSATARSIHMESERKHGPFIVLDCGSIPGNLLESELFGNVKGAFTGAEDRPGVFEEASGGTLFLDEIGELPPVLQPKLLTVLDHNQIRRVGENRQRQVDVRVITATNRDLREEVNGGRFREDLYYRIAVVKIKLPPLRRRPDDLPILVERVITDLGAPREQIDALITPEFMASLANAAWPGNIRELRNYLEQCLVFDDAMPLQTVNASRAPDGTIRVDASLPFQDAKQQVIDQAEREYITQVLKRCDGKVARAAEIAGLNRTYFYRLIKRHGVKTK